MAVKLGVPVSRYIRTRNRHQFSLELRGCIVSWSWPARILLSCFSGGGKGGSPSVDASPSQQTQGKPGAIPSWYKRVRGRTYHTYDLGPIEGAEDADPDRLHKYDYAKAVTVLRSEFGDLSKTLGSGTGITRAPLKQVPAEWRFER